MKLAVIIAIAILGFVPPRPSHGQDVATERAILIELFDATDGPNWKRKDGWRSDRPSCEWEGVWCGIDGKAIIELQLWENNLRGSLPPSLVQLRNLKG